MNANDRPTAGERFRRFVAAHRIITAIGVSLVAIALHLWTAHLFFEHWGRFWAIVGLFLPAVSEIVAIGACPWWGAWFYGLAVVALLVAFGVCSEGDPARPARPVYVGQSLAGLAFIVFAISFILHWDATDKRADDARRKQEVERAAYGICCVLSANENPDDVTKVVAEKDRLRRWIEDHDDTEVKRRVHAFLRAWTLQENDIRRFLANAEGWDSRFIVSPEARETFSALPKVLQELLGSPPDDWIRQLQSETSGRSLRDAAKDYDKRASAVIEERYADIFKSPMPSREELMRPPESEGK